MHASEPRDRPTAQPLDPVDPSEQRGRVAPPPPRQAGHGARAQRHPVGLRPGRVHPVGRRARRSGRRRSAPWRCRVPWSPAQGELAWAACCLLVTAGSVLFTFHGLHPYRVGQRVWRDATTPRISVWRPVEPDWEEAAAEAAEEDEREHARRAQAHRAPVADAGNPLGWVVD